MRVKGNVRVVQSRAFRGSCGVLTTALLALSGPGNAGATVTLGPPQSNNSDAGTAAGCVNSNTAINQRLVASPVNGTVIGWGLTATSINTSARLRVLTPVPGGAHFTASSGVGSSPGNGHHSFATSVPISIGDRIGIEVVMGSVGSIGNSFPLFGAAYESYCPVPADGTTPSFTGATNGIYYQVDAEVDPANQMHFSQPTKHKKKGTATVMVSVPNPGVLVLAQGLLKSQTLTAPGPETLPVELLPTRKTRAKLRRQGKATGVVGFSFTPSFGSTHETNVGIGLRLKAKH